MNSTVTLPNWRFFGLLLAANYALIVSVLFPAFAGTYTVAETRPSIS